MTTWSATRFGVILLGVAASAANYASFGGIWALDSARSDLGQCRKVETLTLRVEYTAAHVTVIELARDEFGGHVVQRELTAFRREGNTIQLRAEQQPKSAPPEQWTLSSDGTQLSMRRQCGQSVQRLVFHRSTKIGD